MTETKCDRHSEDIVKINTELQEYKKTTNQRLDEIIEEIKKPFLTPYQITGLLLTIVIYMASMFVYVSNTKSDTRNNTTRITNVEETEDNNTIRYENIDLKLEILLTKVAVLEAKED